MGLLSGLMARLPTDQAWILAVQAGQLEGVEPALLMAEMERESGFDPNPPVRAGDESYGLMQLTPATASGLLGHAVDIQAELIDNPLLNVRLGARYLAYQLHRYGGSVPDGVAAYNAGSARRNAAGQYVNTHGVPNVQSYVDGVLGAYARWRQQGAPAVTVTTTGERSWQAVTASPWAWVVGGALGLTGLVWLLGDGR